MAERPKQKIAVLGGGCGALAAVFALTDQDQAAFDITVYQPGWRLGGKGASGRNAAHGQRIEEHGLHVWSGFYENAFWMMRKCYAELGRPSTHPMATAFSAFLPRHFTSMGFRATDGSWDFWKGYLPHETGLPGDAIAQGAYEVVDHLRSPWQLISAFIPWALRYLQATTSVSSGSEPEGLGSGEWLTGNLLGRKLNERHAWTRPLWTALDVAFLGAASLRLWRAFAVARRYAESPVAKGQAMSDEANRAYHALADRLQCFQRWAHYKQESHAGQQQGDSNVYAQIDLFAGLLAGVLRDGAIEHGFDVLDDLDLCKWLAKHSVSARSLRHPTVESIYCYIFAYEGGDPSKPSVAAGVATRLLMRLLLCSRGAVFWEMHAGMGDTVFAPLYEVLKRRGVRFRFFHRALEVRSNHGGQVDSVTLGRQADGLGGGDYDPLVEVKNLPCWPSKPKTELLVQGEDLDRFYPGPVCDLESSLTDWPDVGEQELKAGVDFDWLILGVSVAALPGLCPTIARHSDSFRNAITNLGTVRTQSMQLWFHQPLADLGWRLPPPILTGFAKPHDTWADLSGVLEREDWRGAAPASVHYMCGVMPDDTADADDLRGFALQEHAQRSVTDTAMCWLDGNASEIWKRSVVPGQAVFDTGLLFGADRHATREDQLASQWLTANIDPSARYVLSLPGTTRYRLRADQTKFINMVIAGDWLHTGLNYGCVEGAVIGGLQAARAICGHPAEIHGERDIRSR